MSEITQVFPQCDICDETHPDIMANNVEDLVFDLLTHEGWLVASNGDFICPDCKRKEEGEDK